MQLWKGGCQEFIQTDTNFFNNHFNATNLLECLCVSQGRVLPIPTHWLELCSFIHSTDMLWAPATHQTLIQILEVNSEQGKWDSLPSWIFQSDLWDVRFLIPIKPTGKEKWTMCSVSYDQQNILHAVILLESLFLSKKIHKFKEVLTPHIRFIWRKQSLNVA